MLIQENNKLKEENDALFFTLGRLAALKYARNQTSIYIANFENDTGYCLTNAMKALDGYYIGILGTNWKSMYPNIQDQKTYFIALVEDLNNQLLSLDLGPFN